MDRRSTHELCPSFNYMRRHLRFYLPKDHAAVFAAEHGHIAEQTGRGDVQSLHRQVGLAEHIEARGVRARGANCNEWTAWLLLKLRECREICTMISCASFFTSSSHCFGSTTDITLMSSAVTEWQICSGWNPVPIRYWTRFEERIKRYDSIWTRPDHETRFRNTSTEWRSSFGAERERSLRDSLSRSLPTRRVQIARYHARFVYIGSNSYTWRSQFIQNASLLATHYSIHTTQPSPFSSLPRLAEGSSAAPLAWVCCTDTTYHLERAGWSHRSARWS